MMEPKLGWNEYIIIMPAELTIMKLIYWNVLYFDTIMVLKYREKKTFCLYDHFFVARNSCSFFVTLLFGLNLCYIYRTFLIVFQRNLLSCSGRKVDNNPTWQGSNPKTNIYNRVGLPAEAVKWYFQHFNPAFNICNNSWIIYAFKRISWILRYESGGTYSNVPSFMVDFTANCSRITNQVT